MLLLIGLFFFAFALLGSIRLLMMLRRPKTDAVVTELFSGKLKTDTFKMMPDQLHARVKYMVDEKEYTGEIPVLKTMVIKEGDYLPVYYKKEDPKEISLAANKKNWTMLIVIYLISIALMVGSLFISSLFN